MSLSPADRDAYQAIASGRQPDTDVGRLVELGLVTADPYSSDRYMAHDPRMAAQRLMTDAQALVTQTVAQMAHIPALEALADHFDPFRWYGGPGSELLTTREEMNARIGEVLRRENAEMLTAQPGAPVDRDPVVQRMGMARARSALERGVTVKSMYINTVYGHAQSISYLDELTAAGAEVVTLQERFPRMVIVGDNLFIDNLVPAQAESDAGWHVFDRAAVSWAREVYRLAWERGAKWRAVRSSLSVLTERQKAVLRALDGGDSQQQVGPALGLSDRTVTKELAAARVAVGARSMYQLMSWWGRQGGA